MNKESGSSEGSGSVERRSALSAVPSVAEVMGELRAIDRQVARRSNAPSIDRAYTIFMSVLLIELVGIFVCLTMHFQFGVPKEELTEAAGAISTLIGLTVIVLAAYLVWLFFMLAGRVRRVGLAGIQAQTIDLRRSLEAESVERLSHLPVIDLEDLEQDLAQQSSEATAKSVWAGGVTALFTAASKMMLDAHGWTVETSPLLLLVAALIFGFGVGASLYLLPKPKFDRASSVVKKAIRRAKARQPKDSPGSWKPL